MRSHTVPARMAQRARIVLLSDEGMTGREIVERVGCSQQTVVAWRARYAKDGLAGLEDRPRPGRPATIDEDKESHILATTFEAFRLRGWG